MSNLILKIKNQEEMIALGHTLGKSLFPGAVAALIGQLGAGKTFLVRAISEGLEIPNAKVVNSPTFVLIQEYEGRLPIYHFDAYRLHSVNEFYDLGSQEYFESNGVSLVEWADRVEPCLPKEHLRIELTITGETSRSLKITAQGSKYELLLSQLAEMNFSADRDT